MWFGMIKSFNGLLLLASAFLVFCSVCDINRYNDYLDQNAGKPVSKWCLVLSLVLIALALIVPMNI